MNALCLSVMQHGLLDKMSVELKFDSGIILVVDVKMQWFSILR